MIKPLRDFYITKNMTPKRLACQILDDTLELAGYWGERDADIAKLLTEKNKLKYKTSSIN